MERSLQKHNEIREPSSETDNASCPPVRPVQAIVDLFQETAQGLKRMTKSQSAPPRHRWSADRRSSDALVSDVMREIRALQYAKKKAVRRTRGIARLVAELEGHHQSCSATMKEVNAMTSNMQIQIEALTRLLTDTLVNRRTLTEPRCRTLSVPQPRDRRLMLLSSFHKDSTGRRSTLDLPTNASLYDSRQEEICTTSSVPRTGAGRKSFDKLNRSLRSSLASTDLPNTYRQRQVTLAAGQRNTSAFADSGELQRKGNGMVEERSIYSHTPKPGVLNGVDLSPTSPLRRSVLTVAVQRDGTASPNTVISAVALVNRSTVLKQRSRPLILTDGALKSPPKSIVDGISDSTVNTFGKSEDSHKNTYASRRSLQSNAVIRTPDYHRKKDSSTVSSLPATNEVEDQSGSKEKQDEMKINLPYFRIPDEDIHCNKVDLVSRRKTRAVAKASGRGVLDKTKAPQTLENIPNTIKSPNDSNPSDLKKLNRKDELGAIKGQADRKSRKLRAPIRNNESRDKSADRCSVESVRGADSGNFKKETLTDMKMANSQEDVDSKRIAESIGEESSDSDFISRYFKRQFPAKDVGKEKKARGKKAVSENGIQKRKCLSPVQSRSQNLKQPDPTQTEEEARGEGILISTTDESRQLETVEDLRTKARKTRKRKMSEMMKASRRVGPTITGEPIIPHRRIEGSFLSFIDSYQASFSDDFIIESVSSPPKEDSSALSVLKARTTEHPSVPLTLTSKTSWVGVLPPEDTLRYGITPTQSAYPGTRPSPPWSSPICNNHSMPVNLDRSYERPASSDVTSPACPNSSSSRSMAGETIQAEPNLISPDFPLYTLPAEPPETAKLLQQSNMIKLESKMSFYLSKNSPLSASSSPPRRSTSERTSNKRTGTTAPQITTEMAGPQINDAIPEFLKLTAIKQESQKNTESNKESNKSLDILEITRHQNDFNELERELVNTEQKMQTGQNIDNMILTDTPSDLHVCESESILSMLPHPSTSQFSLMKDSEMEIYCATPSSSEDNCLIKMFRPFQNLETFHMQPIPLQEQAASVAELNTNSQPIPLQQQAASALGLNTNSQNLQRQSVLSSSAAEPLPQPPTPPNSCLSKTSEVRLEMALVPSEPSPAVAINRYIAGQNWQTPLASLCDKPHFTSALGPKQTLSLDASLNKIKNYFIHKQKNGFSALTLSRLPTAVKPSRNTSKVTTPRNIACRSPALFRVCSQKYYSIMKSSNRKSKQDIASPLITVMSFKIPKDRKLNKEVSAENDGRETHQAPLAIDTGNSTGRTRNDDMRFPKDELCLHISMSDNEDGIQPPLLRSQSAPTDSRTQGKRETVSDLSVQGETKQISPAHAKRKPTNPNRNNRSR